MIIPRCHAGPCHAIAQEMARLRESEARLARLELETEARLTRLEAAADSLRQLLDLDAERAELRRELRRREAALHNVIRAQARHVEIFGDLDLDLENIISESDSQDDAELL